MNTIDVIEVMKYFNDFHGYLYYSLQKNPNKNFEKEMIELREYARKAQEQFNAIVTELDTKTYLTEILNKNFLVDKGKNEELFF